MPSIIAVLINSMLNIQICSAPEPGSDDADLISYLDEFDVAAQSDKDNSSQVPALV